MFADRIYADFQNLDDEQRIRLTAAGSVRDLAASPALAVGEEIGLYTDDSDDDGLSNPLFVDGTIEEDPHGDRMVRVNWATIRSASDEFEVFRRRFFDTAVAEVLRSLDGRALIGGTLQALCVLDYLAFLKTGRGEATDFESVALSYLPTRTPAYDPAWLWQVRNALAHAHGTSRKMRTGSAAGVWFTDRRPEDHLRSGGSARGLNVETLIADVIVAANRAFDDFRNDMNVPLAGFRQLLIVGQSDAAAFKPYAKMHRLLDLLDVTPVQTDLSSRLEAAIGKMLSNSPVAIAG